MAARTRRLRCVVRFCGLHSEGRLTTLQAASLTVQEALNSPFLRKGRGGRGSRPQGRDERSLCFLSHRVDGREKHLIVSQRGHILSLHQTYSGLLHCREIETSTEKLSTTRPHSENYSPLTPFSTTLYVQIIFLHGTSKLCSHSAPTYTILSQEKQKKKKKFKKFLERGRD